MMIQKGNSGQMDTRKDSSRDSRKKILEKNRFYKSTLKSGCLSFNVAASKSSWTIFSQYFSASFPPFKKMGKNNYTL